MFNKKRKTVVPPAKMEGQFNFSVQQEEEETCFDCHICGSSYTNSAHLKRHINSTHYAVEMGDVEDQGNDDEIEFVEYNAKDDDGMPERLYDMMYSQMYSNEDGEEEEEEVADEIIESIRTTAGEDTLWNTFTERTHPVANVDSMVMHAFVDGDNDMISRRILQKILFTINLLLKIKETAIEKNRKFKLPTLNTLLNFQTLKKNKIPIFPTKEVKIPLNGGESVTAGLNLPSDHIKLLMANPKKSSLISSVPDRSKDMSISLQQGEKWKNNFFFQQPMMTVRGIDYWYGDLICIIQEPYRVDFFIESFHTNQDQLQVRRYNVRYAPTGQHVGIELSHTDFDASQLPEKKEDKLNPDLCCSISQNSTLALTDSHRMLIIGDHRFKKRINKNTEDLYKVKIAPVILFTDDTSGNRLKQYNAYKSWSMKCGALSFEDRCSIKNIRFISAIPKKDGASGISLLRTIVDDLKQLEQGMVMYSAEKEKNVLVISPVLWIEADNPCHSELCGLLGSTTLFPCRKCYVRFGRSKNKDMKEVGYYTKEHVKRTRARYCLASENKNRSSLIVGAPESGTTLGASDLSYSFKNTDVLLELQAFDPATDTPVEILHGILLGIARYLITDLVKVVLKGDRAGELTKLSEAIKSYQKTTGLSRKFTKKLEHCGSFLGRDFKTLAQILPVVLLKDFHNDATLKEITKPFVKLGILCSLIFVRRVKSGLEEYLKEVDDSVKKLIESLHHYDKNCKIVGHNPYCLKLKVHLLTHLTEDIKRFGPALNFETEKGEQFNKHIREHLFFTNRLETSRDIARKFGKQVIMRHVVDGGSWIGEDCRRERNGIDIACFVNEYNEHFFYHLAGGSREFSDNNGSTNTQKIEDGSLAVFTSSVGDSLPFLGLVCGTYVQRFGLISSDGLKNGHYTAMAIEPFPSMSTDTLNITLVLDTFKYDNNMFMINLNKFGVYWYFKKNISSFPLYRLE